MFASLFAFVVAAAGPAANVPVPAASATIVPANFQFQTQTIGSTHPFLVGLIQALFIILAVGLVALMSVQTTKNEGLSGAIGGRAESAYRGRLGFDQQLARLTGFIAIAFVVLAISYFVVTR